MEPAHARAHNATYRCPGAAVTYRISKAMLREDGYNFFEDEGEQQRAAEREDDVVGAEPGEEDVGLCVAQEVLDGEDGGEVRGHDGEHRGRR